MTCGVNQSGYISIPKGKSDCPLKLIKFALPIVLDEKEIDEMFLNKPLFVKTLVCLVRKTD